MIEWETPQDLFDNLNKEFHFILDVCATKENTKCVFYFTKEENALNRDWGKKVCWMNPPYDKTINLWMKKAYEASQSGATVVCLIRGRSTDTKWWHEFIMRASEIRFIKGRLRFCLNGKPFETNTYPYNNILIVFYPYSKGPPNTLSIDTNGVLL